MRWVCEGTAKHLDTADHYDERCYAVSTRQHTDNQHIKLEDSTWQNVEKLAADKAKLHQHVDAS